MLSKTFRKCSKLCKNGYNTVKNIPHHCIRPIDETTRETMEHNTPQPPEPHAAEAPFDYAFVETVGRVAIYDDLRSAPRVIEIQPADTAAYIEALASCVYEQARAAGGSIPYTVIREVSENFIHAQFKEAVVSIFDQGNTVRFADHGPGIPSKEKAQMPGFSSAVEPMKHYIRGVGSGLPIVREYLESSHGTITIEDNLGTGAVVTISLAENPLGNYEDAGLDDLTDEEPDYEADFAASMEFATEAAADYSPTQGASQSGYPYGTPGAGYPVPTAAGAAGVPGGTGLAGGFPPAYPVAPAPTYPAAQPPAYPVSSQGYPPAGYGAGYGGAAGIPSQAAPYPYGAQPGYGAACPQPAAYPSYAAAPAGYGAPTPATPPIPALSPRERKFLKMLAAEGMLSNRELSRLAEEAESTTNTTLKKMQEAGLVQMVGKQRTLTPYGQHVAQSF